MLELVKRYDIKVAILKNRSPSCGKTHIYDGSFSKKLVDGMGITASLLQENGVKLFTEDEIDAALLAAEKCCD